MGIEDWLNHPMRIEDVIRQDEWWTVDNFNGWTASTTGTGATARGPRNGRVASGTTNGGKALIRTGDLLGWSANQNKQIINWSKALVVHLQISILNIDTSGTYRFTLGKATGDSYGALDDKGIGLRITSDTVTGFVHDGTSGADWTAAPGIDATMVGDVAIEITMVADGAGNVSWYAEGGFLWGSTTVGPTGLSTSAHNIVQAETENGSNVNHNVILHNLKIFVGQ